MRLPALSKVGSKISLPCYLSLHQLRAAGLGALAAGRVFRALPILTNVEATTDN